MSRYTLEVRRFGRREWKKLSVSAKSEFTQFEIECYRHQWAADHQENPSCVCVRALKDGELWAVFPSDAAINAEGIEA